MIGLPLHKFQNGEGEEIGTDIDRIVKEAKKLINESK